MAWMLGGPDNTALETVDADTFEEGLGMVVAGAVDKVAAEDSYIPSLTADSMVMDVAGVRDYASYRKMVSLLTNLAMVRSVAVETIVPGKVTLALGLEGSGAEFIQALSAYEQIAVDSPDAGEGHLSATWRQPISLQ